MKQLKTILLKLFILPYLILIVHLVCNYQAIRLDGLDAEVWRFYAEEDTQYSENFSHKKFSEITSGMTKKQVASYLGEPLRRWPVNETPTGRQGDFWVLSFSVPVDGKSYRQRFVYIQNDIVVETKSEMYYD